MPARSGLPTDAVLVRKLADWSRWLQEHHSQSAGVWVVTYKAGASQPRVPYDALVCEAICWGWIDSLPRALDAERTMLRFAARRATTGWSRINKERVERMLREGRMRPQGLAKVEAAKRDGSWSKLDQVENLVLPDDLAAALRSAGDALSHWDAFPRSVKRGILEWIQSARRQDTRAKRIAETARLAAQGKRANQWRSS